MAPRFNWVGSLLSMLRRIKHRDRWLFVSLSLNLGSNPYASHNSCQLSPVSHLRRVIGIWEQKGRVGAKLAWTLSTLEQE